MAAVDAAPRLTPAYGLKTIPELKKLHGLDLRRTGASIALVRSMQQRTVYMSPCPKTAPMRSGFDGQDGAAASPRQESAPASSRVSDMQEDAAVSPRVLSMCLTKVDDNMTEEAQMLQRSSPNQRRKKTLQWKSYVNECNNKSRERSAHDIANLEDAFYAISASFDMDGDGTINSEELINIFARCQMFDEWLTPNRVRDYFRTVAVGCNQVVQGGPIVQGVDCEFKDTLHQFVQGVGDKLKDGIDYESFEGVLRWSADLKGADFSRCVARVLRLSRRLCDGRSSDRRKLEMVFDAFCKTQQDRMNLNEFLAFCKRVDVYQPGKFTVADVYSIFYQLDLAMNGMDFDEFTSIVSMVGEKLGIGEAIFKRVADAAAKLDVDESTIRKVKIAIKHAASRASSIGWRQFFRECDEDDSGHMDWEEFHHMCRDRLKLPEQANHLKMLFEKLDKDDSGELSIDELIDYIEQG